jgi:hypothetical protein
LVLRAARDRSFELSFGAIPYSESLCFRPPLLPKPQMAGTVPARVTSSLANDPYSHIDSEGRYKVSFLFDRDTWKLGQESLWLRLARPYAGDTHGLHLPLICGTEVAIAFEQGDPDRPYIAHALHDSRHPDHVTLLRRDYTRNVLRTPANNKLRMEDERGKEHIKLSTEHSGKSQLNLGHLVDDEKLKRGEGFELRTDGRGAIRAGSGLFISADEQTKAHGQQLELESIAATCEQYGFGEFDGSGFNSAPDNSYGNAPSNVAHLYDLYPDNTATPLSEDAEIGYVRVYVEGIGTRSGGADATLIGQGLGQGETGVVARVRQTPDMLSKQLGFFQQKNPGITIRNLEFDLFGFSRGAAAARHCAN